MRKTLVAVSVLASGAWLGIGCDSEPVDGTAVGPSVTMTGTCGNSIVEAGEACDDGNRADGDWCSAFCTAHCGDGKISNDEQCDDGNQDFSDGCGLCRLPNALLWERDLCRGLLRSGLDGSVQLVCKDLDGVLAYRFNVDGSSVGAIPAPTDAVGNGLSVVGLVEQTDGVIFAVKDVVNSVPRTRVYKTDNTGNQIWRTFLGGDTADTPASIAGNATGLFAVAGTVNTESAAFRNPFVAILNSAGELQQRIALTTELGAKATVVSISDDGYIVIGGSSQVTVGDDSATMAKLWGLTPTGELLWSQTVGSSTAISELRPRSADTTDFIYTEGIAFVYVNSVATTTGVLGTRIQVGPSNATATNKIARFATLGSDYSAVVATTLGGVGYSSEGTLHWSVRDITDLGPALTATLAQGPVFCQHFSTGNLKCYLSH